MISERLDDLCIDYITQYKFDNCKGIRGGILPYDFYLPKYNICIEFDGRQHYEPVDRFGGQVELEKLQKNDEIRNNYCQNNGLLLFRIKYNRIDDDYSKLITYINANSDTQQLV